MMDFHLGIMSLISTVLVVIGGVRMERQSALLPKLESSPLTMILTFELKLYSVRMNQRTELVQMLLSRHMHTYWIYCCTWTTKVVDKKSPFRVIQGFFLNH